jgi:hypothetical protein
MNATQTRTRNYRKNPHKAAFLMAFHAGTNGLPSDLETETEDLLDTVPDAPADLRTEAQVNFMDRLIEQVAALDPAAGSKAAHYTDGMTEHGRWTPGRTGNASSWIDRLKAKIAELKAAQAPAAPAELEDGIYELDGNIYKVVHAVHGSGRQYAKVLVPALDEGDGWSWEMSRGTVAKLTPAMKMGLERAKELGRIYGVCVRCGAVLTDEESIAAGIGPTCRGKM